MPQGILYFGSSFFKRKEELLLSQALVPDLMQLGCQDRLASELNYIVKRRRAREDKTSQMFEDIKVQYARADYFIHGSEPNEKI